MAVNAAFTNLDGKANLVVEAQRRDIAIIKEQISSLANHTADLASAYQETRIEEQLMRSSIPLTIETVRDPAVQAILDNNKDLSAQVATLTNTINNSNYSGILIANRVTGHNEGGRSRGSRTGDGECRQFNKYCSSCGDNLSHLGKDCKTKKH